MFLVTNENMGLCLYMAKLIILGYDNFGEYHNPVHRNGMTAIPKTSMFELWVFSRQRSQTSWFVRPNSEGQKIKSHKAEKSDHKAESIFVMMLQGWMMGWLTIQLALDKASSLVWLLLCLSSGWCWSKLLSNLVKVQGWIILSPGFDLAINSIVSRVIIQNKRQGIQCCMFQASLLNE